VQCLQYCTGLTAAFMPCMFDYCASKYHSALSSLVAGFKGVALQHRSRERRGKGRRGEEEEDEWTPLLRAKLCPCPKANVSAL